MIPSYGWAGRSVDIGILNPGQSVDVPIDIMNDMCANDYFVIEESVQVRLIAEGKTTGDETVIISDKNITIDIDMPRFSILTDKEMTQIKSHTFLGAEILIKYIDSLGYLPALVAFEHHLKYNLGGYPKLKYPKKPSTVSSIVSLCDCYDALRSRRSYKNDYPPEMIYEIMLREKGKGFDPELFDKFFSFIGLYPLGTVVELTNNFI